jgi:hypothetical protein
MPQLVIDPNNRGIPAGQKSIAQLPELVRRLGHVPDLAQCKAGDLILSCSIKPTFSERTIISAQIRAGFSAEDSRWTHAAVFLYEDFIVEADPKRGVSSRSLYFDVPTSF